MTSFKHSTKIVDLSICYHIDKACTGSSPAAVAIEKPRVYLRRPSEPREMSPGQSERAGKEPGETRGRGRRTFAFDVFYVVTAGRWFHKYLGIPQT